MLSRRSLLKALVSIPFLGRILPTPSTSSVKKVSEVIEKMTIGIDSPMVFDLRSLPLPIVHSDFWFSARLVVLSTSKVGSEFDPYTETHYDDNGLPIEDAED